MYTVRISSFDKLDFEKWEKEKVKINAVVSVLEEKRSRGRGGELVNTVFIVS